MATKECLDNIRKQNPPVYCNEIEPGWCERLQATVNNYCRHMDLPPNTPVPMLVKERDCWCCCGFYSGTGTPVEVEPGLYRMVEEVERFRLADGQVLSLITTSDHLFLRPDGTLTAVRDLLPGDEVRQADGGVAVVEQVGSLEFDGGIRHVALGQWRRGEPLDGHLINAGGLVIADLAVQVEYYGAAGG
jgi:hypothetical protein